MARASASVVGSGTVGPEPITAGSSPGTSEIASVSTRAGCARLRQPSALDAREMLSHRVDLADVGAGAQQRPRHRLLVGERQSLRRRDPVGRRAARQQHQHQIVRPGAVGQARAPARRPASPAASGIGWPASTIGIELGRPAIAVPRHGDAGRAVPAASPRNRPLRHLGHRAGGLAGGQHDQPARFAAAAAGAAAGRPTGAPRQSQCETARPEMPSRVML